MLVALGLEFLYHNYLRNAHNWAQFSQWANNIFFYQSRIPFILFNWVPSWMETNGGCVRGVISSPFLLIRGANDPRRVGLIKELIAFLGRWDRGMRRDWNLS